MIIQTRMKEWKMPFNYYLEWNDTGYFYHGARWASYADPSCLMTTYFTSSKTAKDIIQRNGLPDIVTFQEHGDAKYVRTRESELIKDSMINPLCINFKKLSCDGHLILKNGRPVEERVVEGYALNYWWIEDLKKEIKQFRKQRMNFEKKTFLIEFNRRRIEQLTVRMNQFGALIPASVDLQYHLIRLKY